MDAGARRGARLGVPQEPSSASGRGRGHVVALREIHSDALELRQHLRRLDRFGDGRDAKCLADLADGFHHAPIDRVGGDVADELPVDLQKVDRQRLQIQER